MKSKGDTKINYHIYLLLLSSIALCSEPVLAEKALALHPENPHYFIFRGKPTVLVGSGEHYGALVNLDFDYIAYLDELKENGLNHTRIFSGVYRESPSSFAVTDNTLAPLSHDKYICPWSRSAQPGATNGGNKFDLSTRNPAYFKRLKDFVRQASKRGIIVEVNLFCRFYSESLWTISPLNALNNINGIGNCSANEVYTLKHPHLTAVQEAVTRKIVQELRDADNIYYEVCNQPELGEEIMEWQKQIIRVIAETEKNLPAKHLISLNIVNESEKIHNPPPEVSIFNFHYCYPPDVVAMNYHLNKVIGDNETGFMGKDDVVYRVEGWEFIIAGGALYSNLDYSFTYKHPRGTFLEYQSPGGGSPTLRRQLKILKDFIHSFNFIKMAPGNEVIKSVSDGVRARALVQKDRQYAIYTHEPPEAGKQAKERRVEIAIELPAGTYTYQWVNTKTGEIGKRSRFQHGGGVTTLLSPLFMEDIALRLVSK